MGKRIRLNSKDRSGILSLFNKKGYRKGKRGQPKIKSDVKDLLIVKVKQYQKRYNLSPYAAWVKITKLKNFPELLKLQYKNKKGRANADWWIARFKLPEKETGIRANYYRNHIRKWIS
tara:strand:+ start:39 stop:392 length:354 start_codon:yes stop_codon:yes gene_type:complete